jgi:hypothetical protein
VHVETVTPEQAVARGWWMVTAPSLALLIVPLISYAIWMPSEYRFGAAGIGPFALVFLISAGLSWLAWSILVPQWRLWAYQRVANIAELKDRALAANLIWPERSIFARTEIASKELRSQLRRLEGAAASNDA